MDARIPKLLSERVLCAHWKGVVYSLKRCCCHIFDISKPFCHYNSGILCHAEQQVAINPTYSNLFIYLNNINNINNKWFLPVILENNCEMKCVYPKFTTCYLVTWNKMVKLPCYLILCQCYLDIYNWCHVTLLPEMFFHCYLVTCPKYPMLPCYLKTVNRPQWKLANVTPIYKKGSTKLPGNYRPVSLTSVVCKMMERLVRNQLMNHLTRTTYSPIHNMVFVRGHLPPCNCWQS